jgi:hypothetical protein
MFDWYSEYVVIQARQQEMAAAARMRRLLAEAKGTARQPGNRGIARPARSLRLRYRLGAALVQLGRRLQGCAPELPHAPGQAVS